MEEFTSWAVRKGSWNLGTDMNVVNVVAPGALVTLLISVVSTYVGPLLVHSRHANQENNDRVSVAIQASHQPDSASHRRAP